ncbi:MAG: glycerophosphodiester phosphodiesterase [Myxococcaceae bacterium]|nr:glycerophosphodiester phosphodiesterase [Myxococcaceae bacterium]
MRILGHRGASADFPENTIEAFRGAMAQGADGVELDVMRCGSGELVVCHDEWLTRLAGLRWEVAHTPWWKLSRADVGGRLGFAAARIPLLDEVFAALPTDAVVNVELKCETVDDGGLSVEVGRFLEARGLSERAFVSSFNPLCLVRLARAFPGLRRGLLVDPDKAWLPQVAWLPVAAKTSIHPHASAVTEARMKAWRALRYEVAVWTVDDVQEARRLEALGVDWLITNRPLALRQALGRA